MKGSWRFWGVVATLPILHFFIHVGLGFSAWSPDLLTVALLLGARELRMGAAAGLGFFFGLMEDAFSVLAFGANTMAMTIVGLVGARSRDLFMGDSLLFLISYLALGKWVRDLLHWLVSAQDIRAPALEMLLFDAPTQAIYAALAGALLILLVGAWREPIR